VRKADALKDANGLFGNKTRAKVVKNKLAPPFKTAEFDIIYGEGISNTGCIVDLGATYDVLEKSGSWFSYKGEKIAQGREKAREYFTNNPEIAKEVEAKIKEKVASNPGRTIVQPESNSGSEESAE